jgi:hypothetical protein
MLKGLPRIATALSVLAMLAGGSVCAQSPTPNPNQTTANAVATALRASPSLRGQRIDIEAVNGQVTLVGTLAHPAQRHEALARAQRVPGVVAVIDRLRVAPDARVRPAQYQVVQGLGGGFEGGPLTEGVPMIAGGGPLMRAAPMTMIDGTAAGAMGGPLPEAMSGGLTGQPALGNYAWPNAGAMGNAGMITDGGMMAGGASAGGGYPTTYPWQAWTSVRPPYPMPEIPFEWRTVTLRWDDGIWWLDFKKHYDRPFFTPWPFQIFAY